jgi:hypothetical protein
LITSPAEFALLYNSLILKKESLKRSIKTSLFNTLRAGIFCEVKYEEAEYADMEETKEVASVLDSFISLISLDILTLELSPILLTV